MYAGVGDNFGDEIWDQRQRKPKLLRQPVESVLVFLIEQHGTITE